MIYTGIGSRKTPEDVLFQMQAFGSAFARMGFTLRSGAAPGADIAFEQGCFSAMGPKEIYLPWKNFSKHPSELYDIPDHVFEVAADLYGPSWKYLKRTSRLFMARDVQQVLGKNLDSPSQFVVCWTPDGCTSKAQRTRKTGGTGQAIACASEHNIPVFNLFNEDGKDELISFVENLDGMEVD